MEPSSRGSLLAPQPWGVDRWARIYLSQKHGSPEPQGQGPHRYLDRGPDRVPYTCLEEWSWHLHSHAPWCGSNGHWPGDGQGQAHSPLCPWQGTLALPLWSEGRAPGGLGEWAAHRQWEGTPPGPWDLGLPPGASACPSCAVSVASLTSLTPYTQLNTNLLTRKRGVKAGQHTRRKITASEKPRIN